MTDIIERLRNRQLHDMEYVDAMTREAADEIERLRALILDGCAVFEHYDLPEHALYYRRRALEPKP